MAPVRVRTGLGPGHEAGVLGNCATTAHSAHGWQLVDRNGRATKLDDEMSAGASAIITLDGSGVQLGINGGNLLLLDDHGAQIDSVT